MRKKLLSVAVICAMIGSMSLSSCIGSFKLTNSLLEWNRSIDNKFVNEVVFLAFWILPVYEVAGAADMLVLNSIEFWTGESPIAMNQRVIEGNDGKYLVKSDESGYTITSLNDNSVVKLNYDSTEQTWSLTGVSGTEYPLMTFVDANHIKVNVGDGQMMLIEKSNEGLYALQQAITQNTTMLAQR